MRASLEVDASEPTPGCGCRSLAPCLRWRGALGGAAPPGSTRGQLNESRRSAHGTLDRGSSASPLRRLRTRPTYTLLAVLTLALGVGGMAAIAGIVRPLLVNPLPYHDATRARDVLGGRLVAQSRIRHAAAAVDGFASVAAYRPEDVTARGRRRANEIRSRNRVEHRVVRVLRRPTANRPWVSTAKKTLRAPSGRVLSDALWRELGGDLSIVGTPLKLDGIQRTVIGVMPPGFWFPDPSIGVWLADYINPTGRTGCTR